MESRLDVMLVLKGLVNSRSKATMLIHDGKVKINDKIITKPAYLVNDNDNIIILENELLKYVSRGGLKLQRALDIFNVDVNNLYCLDIGSSTGGFTDCLLKHGANKIIALDVGTSQLHESLRNDKRIVVLENTNFKDVNEELVKDVDLFVADVSFISIRKILSHLKEIKENFKIIILFKPQFEVGPAALNAKGVVKNENILVRALEDFNIYLQSNNIFIKQVTYSPFTGQDGNIEFLFYLTTDKNIYNYSPKNLVKEAINNLHAKRTIY